MALYSSPCKVNLILNILGPRPDGFHDLETLFYPVPIFDQLELESNGGAFRFTCNTDRVPTGPTNLVYRAAMLFFEKAAIQPEGHIHLVKNLPVEAGLGAGSANAAFTLRALNREYDSPLEATQLSQLASLLGSDVPFFLKDAPAIGRGRGEKLERLSSLPALAGKGIILIKPNFGVSTAWAYKELARYPSDQKGRPGRVDELVRALTERTLSESVPLFYNSLEAPVLPQYPLLAEYQKFLRELGADVTLMSGSGSTTFALVSSRDAAERMADRFKERFGSDFWIAIAEM
jgi:4-diphosphocytidyl-2-C-methyl-D-erythritol kinase